MEVVPMSTFSAFRGMLAAIDPVMVTSSPEAFPKVVLPVDVRFVNVPGLAVLAQIVPGEDRSNLLPTIAAEETTLALVMEPLN